MTTIIFYHHHHLFYALKYHKKLYKFVNKPDCLGILSLSCYADESYLSITPTAAVTILLYLLFLGY